MSTPQLADGEARRRIAEDLDTTFFVEAAAGTGKTTALVRRILAVIQSGHTTLDRIVAMTFTEKAAGEMRLRLRTEIEDRRYRDELPTTEREALERALEHLEVARISTIHGFCSDLLRERPLQAGIDPRFQVAPEDLAEPLLDRAFDTWFEEVLEAPPPGVRRVLARRPRGRWAQKPRQALRNAVANLVDHRDFDAPWKRRRLDREAALGSLVAQLRDLAAIASEAFNADDYLARNLANIARFLDENDLREAAHGRDLDELEAGLRDLLRDKLPWRVGWHWRGFRSDFGPDLAREDVIARRDWVRDQLKQVLEAAEAELAACLQEELRPAVTRFEELKLREGVLDFLDLLIRARDLIRDHSEVRHQLQQRYSHFFVDEFQDTDPLQLEILLLLTADDPDQDDYRATCPAPGKLFVVGDPKQSIYRFRRADVALYEQIKQRLIGLGAEALHLSTSFRAVPLLQSMVNAAFTPLMSGAADGSQAEYVPLQPYRPEMPGQPAVIALPVPRPYGDYGKIVKWRVEDSFPDAVAALIDWLVSSSGWQVTEPGGSEPQPLQPRHICLLFRRLRRFFDDVTRPYVKALEARRLPHVLVGGRSYHHREEILALRNALHAIEWPDDTLRVFATLRGPFLGFTDDVLLAFRHRIGALHPLRRLTEQEQEQLDQEEQQVAEALSLLGSLHLRRNRRSVAETITRLLAALRAHAGIAVWPNGEQALANVLRLVDHARRFERHGAASFRAFVEHLEEQAELGLGEESPVVEEKTEGVRLMTVHRAKGLEFPVVVLADPTCNLVGQEPSHHVDTVARLWAEPLCGAVPLDLLENREAELARDRAEAVRVAYVAATRARDLLVVPVIGDSEVADEPEEWTDVLQRAVYPDDRRRRQPVQAPGCPAFGHDSVVERPAKARLSLPAVVPGLHRSQAGTQVVWWDPNRLGLDREERLGLRQFELLRADQEPKVADDGIRAHQQWSETHGQLLASGATPSHQLRSATELAAGDPCGDQPVPVVKLAGDHSARPGGARFGTLVHAVLAAVDLEAGPEQVTAVVEIQARLLGAPAAEAEAAIEVVGQALAHPLLAEARSSDDLRREEAILMRLDDGTVVDGVVDLAFCRDGSWTVVDFKTDRELGDRAGRYQAQVRLYVCAIAAATGQPASGVLLVL
jgi:ATP-dependent exoDNAse (exonuclease V) beta subunit